MADEIRYCDACGNIILSNTVESGRAIVTAQRMMCESCADGLPPEEREKFVPAGSRVRNSTRRNVPRVSERAPSRNLTPIIMGASIGGGLLVGLVVTVLLRGGKSAPQPAPPSGSVAVPGPSAGPGTVAVTPGAKPPPVVAAHAPQRRRAQSALNRLRLSIRPELANYSDSRDALTKFMEEFAGLPEAEEARKILAGLDAQYAASAEKALAEALERGKQAMLDGEIRVARSGVKMIAPVYSEGIWLDTVGKQKVEEALAELNKTMLDPANDKILGEIEEAKGYTLIYDLNLNMLSHAPEYNIDKSGEYKDAFSRVAYLLELGEEMRGPSKWVFVSMDKFTDDVGKIGVPGGSTGAKFQCPVKNMTVVSNVSELKTGTELEGNIEFWPNNYAGANSADVPGADGKYDIGDKPVGDNAAFGSMQVHNTPEKQTVFAVNDFRKGGGADMGIGNSTGRTYDWTWTKTGKNYKKKRLRVFVK